jgi:hypothetical protein
MIERNEAFLVAFLNAKLGPQLWKFGLPVLKVHQRDAADSRVGLALGVM